MTHISPTAFCVWSVTSSALGAFLIGHLWRFDRFKCLRWSNSPYSGAFKRLMTYTYLLSIPLIMTYSIGFAYMKYKVGFIVVPGGGVVPTPYYLWPESYQRAIFPLMMVFSFAWSFELITHLEELCFWLFLMNAGSQQPDWFRSPYFRFWTVGSVGALVYVPIITIVYQHNPISCEAHTFLAGSIGDLVLTLAFVPILISFPGFLRNVKMEGVDMGTMVRLRKFFELNVIRVIFRFLFVLPLLALGIDGVKGHTHHLNESLFWTDFFVILAALGCACSSVCTLLVFFPRSHEAEYQAYEASLQQSANTPSSRLRGQSYQRSRLRLQLRRKATNSTRSQPPEVFEQDVTSPIPKTPPPMATVYSDAGGATHSPKGLFLLTDSPVLTGQVLDPDCSESVISLGNAMGGLQRSDSKSQTLYDLPIDGAEEDEYDPWRDGKTPTSIVFSDTPRTGALESYVVDGLPEIAYEQGFGMNRVSRAQSHPGRVRGLRSRPLGNGNGGVLALGLTEQNVLRHNRRESQINPIVHTFTSPLDVLDRGDSPGRPSPYTTGWA